jgi:hypothetical protein
MDEHRDPSEIDALEGDVGVAQHVLEGVQLVLALVVDAASRIEAPFLAAWAIALISAWMVRKQFSSVSPEGVRDE